MEYLPHLTTKLQPLVAKVTNGHAHTHTHCYMYDCMYQQGAGGVSEAVLTMTCYDLQREDWDSLTELAHFSGRPEVTSQIPSQVRA